MASARTIVHACNDLADICDAIKRRAVLAEAQAKGANRQANRLGVRVTGGRGEDEVPYSDPAKDEALNALATLDQVQSMVQVLKQDGYRAAAVLAEFAPDRTDPGGKRCGEDDCARERYSRGYCEPHYRRMLRAEARAIAIEQRRREAS